MTKTPLTQTKTQKIIKVGNSYALTLDKKFVDRTHLKIGEPMVAQYSATSSAMSFARPEDLAKIKDSGKLSQADKRAVLNSKITPELRNWTDNFLKENAQAMKELANL